MKRRELLVLVGIAMAVPGPLRAQYKTLPVIGFLCGGASGAFGSAVAAFGQGLSDTGYVEGQNVTIEYRWAEGRYDALPGLAADLVARKVDVIVTGGGNAPALAAKGATSTIPIVFETGADPVEAHLVASFAWPGSNLTGANILVAVLNPKAV